MDPRDLPLLLNQPELRELYRQLGASPESREKRLTEILLDFYQRMSRDTMIGFFFEGKDASTIALKQKSFVMRAFGAVGSYSGKAPSDAHQNLAPILEGHFNRRLQILDQTLHAHGLSSPQIKVWLSFENAFREAILG